MKNKVVFIFFNTEANRYEIDFSDKKGDSYSVHSITKRDLKEICDLIPEGATVITNKKQFHDLIDNKKI